MTLAGLTCGLPAVSIGCRWRMASSAFFGRLPVLPMTGKRQGSELLNDFNAYLLPVLPLLRRAAGTGKPPPSRRRQVKATYKKRIHPVEERNFMDASL